MMSASKLNFNLIHNIGYLSIYLFIFSKLDYLYAQSDSINFAQHEKKITNHYYVKNAVEKITPKKMENLLREFLYQTKPNRIPGGKGNLIAREFIEKNVMTNMSIVSFSKDTFFVDDKKKIVYATKPGEQSIECQNIVWEKKGIRYPDKKLILGANYDVSFNLEKLSKSSYKNLNNIDLPGADNNGSGVVINLSMIKILEKLDLAKTVQIIFFDCDDRSSLGFKHYIEKNHDYLKAGQESLAGIVYLKSLGHDTKTKDKEKKLRNFNLYHNDPKLVAIFSNKKNESYLQMNFKEQGLKELIEKKSEQSDQSKNDLAFLSLTQALNDSQLPAILFSQNRDDDLNERQNTSNDFYETLNHMTLYQVYFDLFFSILVWNFDILT